MAKGQRLTLAELAKQEKELNKTKKIKLCGKYDETIDLHFKRTKINLLIADYLQLLSELQKREDIDAETVYNSISLLNALIVKYFTSVELPEIRDIETLVAVSNTLFDMGVIDELFGDNDNSFPKEEIEKLSEELNKQTKLLGQHMGELIVRQSLNETEVTSDA